jgi:hypothetical protein
MKIAGVTFPAILLVAVPFNQVAATPTSCEGLASLALPDTTVTLAQTVPAGAFRLPAAPAPTTPGLPSPVTNALFPPPAGLRAVAPEDLPAFCRVVFSVKPERKVHGRW